jgi:hypothetical protein
MTPTIRRIRRVTKPLCLPADARPGRRPRRPRRPEARPRRTRAEIQLETMAWLKREVEPRRRTLTVGCHLVGWYSAAAPLDAVLADLLRWVTDPGHLASRGWPICCRPWDWDAGEDVAVWHGCRLLAMVSRGPDGEARVRRFDRP